LSKGKTNAKKNAFTGPVLIYVERVTRNPNTMGGDDCGAVILGVREAN